MELKDAERPESGMHPIHRLYGGGPKGNIDFRKPAGDLTPDQLKKRREYNRAATRAHRARKKEFAEKGGLAKSVAEKRASRILEKERVRIQKLDARAAKVAEREALRIREREARAETRRLLREKLAAEKKNWRKSLWNARGKRPDLRVPGVGAGVRASRNRLRTQLRRIFGKIASGGRTRDWEVVVEEMETARRMNMPLEIVGEYSLHDGLFNKWTIDGRTYRNPEIFLRVCRELVRRVVADTVGNIKKVELILNAELVRPSFQTDSVEEERDDHRFRSKIHEVFLDSDFDEVWSSMSAVLLVEISEHQGKGSGWILDKIIELAVHVDISKPLSGRSYIPLPKWVRYRGAVVNLQNKGDDCFPLAVAAAIMLKRSKGIRNLERIPKILKKAASNLNMGDLELPMKMTDISKFGELNPTIKLSIFGIEDHDVITILSRRKIGKWVETLPLLLWDDGDGNSHYSPIRCLSALFGRQVSKNTRKMNICDNCLCRFTYLEDLIYHKEVAFCYSHACQETQYSDSEIRFKGVRKTQRVPFVIYSDIESFNIPIEPPETPKNTVKLSKQTPSGLGYCIVGPDGYDSRYMKFDTVEEYVTSLSGSIRMIHSKWFEKEIPLTMSPKDEADYDRATECYRCGAYLRVQGSGRRGNKVRDHDHFTGKFRGASCSGCNLTMSKPRFIPVYFHNLEGYDSHLLISELSKLGNTTCIPRTKESYISFSVELRLCPEMEEDSKVFEVRFLDSFKLMSTGLSGLVATLDDDDLKITKELFPKLTESQFRLLRRKGVYPYDWVDGPNKLEVRSLPPIEDFYNRLSETPCSEEDYRHATEVWKSFGMKRMQNYHDLYLKSDITLLADVVEKFRATCVETYGLDPPWYFTAPGITWDAMLRRTKMCLRTVSDPDIHLFVEGAIRGGISVIVKRHSLANHKYMKSHDPGKPSVFISYQDMNNLYGCAMKNPMPSSVPVWMTGEETENWTGLVGEAQGQDTGIGCFLEVDLDYPDEIHDHHSDYPMACERGVVEGEKCAKLVPNLQNKKEYIIHHDELRQCLKHGLILRKVHRGVKFDQCDWLSEYIDMDTRLRTESKTKFGQDFYKLMNNAVFGKTMEDVRKRIDVKLSRSKSKLTRMVARTGYKGATPVSDFEAFSEERKPLMAVEIGKPRVKMNKPIYVGAAVLSTSKVMMYEFFYGYVKPKWGDKVDLLFTDTDSLCMEIRTEDFYEDIKGDVETRFDTSNIPPNHPAVASVGLSTGRNKRVLGMMKDEAGGRNIVEFIGLRSKMYAVGMEDGYQNTMKCKGIKRAVVERMTLDEYRRCLKGSEEVRVFQNTIRSRGHSIYVERSKKKALCGRDTKRKILEDGIRTIPWGHYSLRT